MREMRRRVEASGWDSLSAGERNCYHPFLLDLKQGDYVVYVKLNGFSIVNDPASGSRASAIARAA